MLMFWGCTSAGSCWLELLVSHGLDEGGYRLGAVACLNQTSNAATEAVQPHIHLRHAYIHLIKYPF